MSYILKLGTFAKKRNSTAQPDMTGWAEYAVTLKTGSDLVNPSVYLHIPEAEAVNYNYAYMLGSYYYIMQKSMDRKDLCTMQLQKDVLASYKAEIGNSNLYIVRSSATFDGNIKDTYYPMLASKTIGNLTVLDNNNITLSQGCYVVNMIGNTEASSTLYLMTPAEFSALIKALYAEAAGFMSLDFSQAAVNAIFDPMDYIRSVIWLPFSKLTASNVFGAVSIAPKHIYAGLWDSGIDGTYLSTCSAVVGTWSIQLAKHPQSDRGIYLNGSPYTEHIIDFAPFGILNLPADRLIDSEYLNIQLVVDAATGMGILQAAGDNNSGVIASVSAQYGVPIPLSGAASNFGAVSSIISGIGEIIGGIASGNVALAATGAAQGIGSFGDSIRGAVSSSGSAGSLAAYQVDKVFYSIFHYISAEDNLNNGRPYCKPSTPAVLGGYMIAEKAPLSISATLPEVDEISSYLTSGFYYE